MAAEPVRETEPDPEENPRGLLERFPALAVFTRRGRDEIPYVQQQSMSECGLASLCMVLGYYGRPTRLEEMRQVIPTDVNGVSAQAVMDAAGYFGLRVRGVAADLDALEELPPGTVLHWKFNHFVVFDRLVPGGVAIVDPARGRVTLTMDKFSNFFTGVAILCEPNDDFEQLPQAKSRLWRYLQNILSAKGLWPRIVVTSLVLELFALASPILMGSLVDRIIPRGDWDLWLVFAVGLATLVFFNYVTTWVRAHLLVYLRANMDVKMTFGFLEHFIELPYPFFQQRASGDLVSRLGDKARIIEGLTAATLSSVLDGSLALLYLFALFYMSPAMGGVVLAVAFVQAAVFVRNANRLKELSTQSLENNAKCSTGLYELVTGVETLKSMGAERVALRQWSNLFVNSINASLEAGRMDANLNAFLGAVSLGAPLIILMLGASEVLHQQMSLGAMLALNALALGFLTPLGNLVQTAVHLRALTSNAERLDDIQNTPRERDRAVLIPAGTLKGGIRVDHVTFRYSPAGPKVLQDISVRINPGQFVAIVGPSGSGKSTLAGLLVGLFPPTEGKIFFDEVDLATLDPTSVRRQFGVVVQKPYLFQASVRQNISLLDPSVPLELVKEAARRAQLHEEILAMPLGYDSLLAEGGSSMSGGQRQRMSLARALARQPKILLLDEATSALDSVTERAIQLELAKIPATKIVIAHRLSTVYAADVILVIDKGRVVEAGKHEELVRRQGLYSRLVAAQLALG